MKTYLMVTVIKDFDDTAFYYIEDGQELLAEKLEDPDDAFQLAELLRKINISRHYEGSGTYTPFKQHDIVIWQDDGDIDVKTYGERMNISPEQLFSIAKHFLSK